MEGEKYGERRDWKQQVRIHAFSDKIECLGERRADLEQVWWVENE